MAKVNQELQALEIFEIEVLDHLNTSGALNQLYFGGGTMLRLCHNLNRYSTDLDFWIKPQIDKDDLYIRIKESLISRYDLVDTAHKEFTLLFQIRNPRSTRTLKIEIRKDQSQFDWERKIAFSQFTNTQVPVNGLTLGQMMTNKVEALLSRKIIRDCFDIEFLYKRGVTLPDNKDILLKILDTAESFKDRDFKVTLGSILDPDERALYNERKFKVLEEAINSKIKLQ